MKKHSLNLKLYNNFGGEKMFNKTEYEKEYNKTNYHVKLIKIKRKQIEDLNKVIDIITDNETNIIKRGQKFNNWITTKLKEMEV